MWILSHEVSEIAVINFSTKKHWIYSHKEKVNKKKKKIYLKITFSKTVHKSHSWNKSIAV